MIALLAAAFITATPALAINNSSDQPGYVTIYNDGKAVQCVPIAARVDVYIIDRFIPPMAFLEVYFGKRCGDKAEIVKAIGE